MKTAVVSGSKKLTGLFLCKRQEEKTCKNHEEDYSKSLSLSLFLSFFYLTRRTTKDCVHSVLCSVLVSEQRRREIRRERVSKYLTERERKGRYSHFSRLDSANFSRATLNTGKENKTWEDRKSRVKDISDEDQETFSLKHIQNFSLSFFALYFTRYTITLRELKRRVCMSLWKTRETDRLQETPISCKTT